MELEAWVGEECVAFHILISTLGIPNLFLICSWNTLILKFIKLFLNLKSVCEHVTVID